MPRTTVFPRLAIVGILSLLLSTPASMGSSLPMTHPTVELVKQYFRHVVNEDWKAAAAMLKPSSIERKKRRMIEIIKRTRTITEETEMLSRLGVKDIREVEAMTVADFYAAERKGLSDRNDETTETIRKQKQESLKVNVLGIIGENKDTMAHLAVRTSQQVMDQQIDELIFLSFEQDPTDSKKWYIVPDMQLPVNTPIAEKAAGDEAKK
jgi:hypothetical protein